MTLVEAVEHDLAGMPEELRMSALAAQALILAERMDDRCASATSVSMCAGRLLDTMNRLRELAPPKLDADGIDDLATRRAERIQRARRAAPTDLDGAAGG